MYPGLVSCPFYAIPIYPFKFMKFFIYLYNNYYVLYYIHVYHSQFTEWDSNLSPVDVRPFVQPTGLVGESTGDPGDLFALFFTPEIVRSIVAETNKYAALCLQGSSTTWTTDRDSGLIWILHPNGPG